MEGAGDSGEVAGEAAGAVDVAGEAAVKGRAGRRVEVEVAVKGAIEGEGETHLPGAVAPCPAAAYASSGDRRDKALAACVLRRVGVRGLVGVDVSARGRWRRDRKGRRLANEFPRPGRPGSRGIRGDGAGLGSHGCSRPARPDGPLAHALALVGRDLSPLGFLAVALAVAAAIGKLPRGSDFGRYSGLSAIGVVPVAVIAILITFGEETGWRGFALPLLQRRYGALAAACSSPRSGPSGTCPTSSLSPLTAGSLRLATSASSSASPAARSCSPGSTTARAAAYSPARSGTASTTSRLAPLRPPRRSRGSQPPSSTS